MISPLVKYLIAGSYLRDLIEETNLKTVNFTIDRKGIAFSGYIFELTVLKLYKENSYNFIYDIINYLEEIKKYLNDETTYIYLYDSYTSLTDEYRPQAYIPAILYPFHTFDKKDWIYSVTEFSDSSYNFDTIPF